MGTVPLEDARGKVPALLAFAAGAILGAAAGSGIVTAEPAVTIRNGILEDWIVTRDDKTLLCRDPLVFIRARQIQCE